MSSWCGAQLKHRDNKVPLIVGKNVDVYHYRKAGMKDFELSMGDLLKDVAFHSFSSSMLY
jgi:hypothetical protein